MDIDMSSIGSVITHLNDYGTKLSGRLVPYGVFLLTGLGSISYAFKMITGFLSGHGINETVANSILKVLPLSIIFWAISTWTDLSVEIVHGFDLVGLALTGADPNASNVALPAVSGVLEIANNMYKAISDRGTWAIVKSFFDSAAWASFISFLIILLIAVIQAGMFIYSQVLINIAIAFGPLMLATFASPLFQGIGMGWINFFIKACLMKIVGLLLIGLIGAMNADLAKAAGQASVFVGNTFHVAGAFTVLMESFVVLVMALSIPKITNDIVGGGITGFGELAANAVNRAASMAKGASKIASGAQKTLNPNKPPQSSASKPSVPNGK